MESWKRYSAIDATSGLFDFFSKAHYFIVLGDFNIIFWNLDTPFVGNVDPRGRISQYTDSPILQ